MKSIQRFNKEFSPVPLFSLVLPWFFTVLVLVTDAKHFIAFWSETTLGQTLLPIASVSYFCAIVLLWRFMRCSLEVERIRILLLLPTFFTLIATALISFGGMILSVLILV